MFALAALAEIRAANLSKAGARLVKRPVTQGHRAKSNRRTPTASFEHQARESISQLPTTSWAPLIYLRREERLVENAMLDLVPTDRVGVYVASELVAPNLLCVCLSDGRRGSARVSVYDLNDGSALRAQFAAPDRARSGVMQLAALGERLLVRDDHEVQCRAPSTGDLLWRRQFEGGIKALYTHPSVDNALVELAADRSLCWLGAETGHSDARWEGEASVVAAGAALGPGPVLLTGWNDVFVARPAAGSGEQAITLNPAPRGVVDVVAVDATGRWALAGTRSGEVFWLDLAQASATLGFRMNDGITAVGFLGASCWALDSQGALQVANVATRETELEVALGRRNHGGDMLPGGTAIALADFNTSALMVLELPSKKARFKTLSGYQVQGVVVRHTGHLYVTGFRDVLCVDPSDPVACKIAKVASRRYALRQLPSGWLIGDGDDVAALAPNAVDGEKLSRVGDSEVRSLALDGGRRLALYDDERVLVHDLEANRIARKIKLTGACLDSEDFEVDELVGSPTGELFLVHSEGVVSAVTALDAAAVVTLDPEQLVSSPDSATLYCTRDDRIDRYQMPEWTLLPPLRSPLKGGIVGFELSPSGRVGMVFHRDGRAAVVDVASGDSVVVDTDATSAAERDDHELFVMDLALPNTCGFSADEQRILWVKSGKIVFIDAASGAVRGELRFTTGAKAYVVVAGDRIDWSGHSKTPPTELEVVEDGRVLSAKDLTKRRQLGLLATLL